MNTRHERVQRFDFFLQDEGRDANRSTTSSDDSPSTATRGTLRGTPSQGYETQWRAQELRRLAREGIPDDPARIRPATYRQLLNLSDPTSLASEYSAFVAEIESRISTLPPPEPHHPLDRYDKLLREIERDVERTFGTLAWFGGRPARNDSESSDEDALWRRIRLLDQLDHRIARELATSTSNRKQTSEIASANATEPSLPPPTLTLNIPSSTDTTAVDIPPTPNTPTSAAPGIPLHTKLDSSSRPTTRREALLRPLFVYAFLNPGVSYVQGMSYLAAVFNYVFSSDSTLSIEEVEATTFFALASLVSQLQDLYVPTHDTNIRGQSLSHGLGATIERFNGLLLWLDPTLADALDRKRVELGGVILRWLTTVFANEFSLPDLVRIWDRIMSVYPSDDQQNEALSPILSHVLDLALALVITNRATFISPYSNMQKIYTILQSPSIEGSAVDKLLVLAWDIRERRLGRHNVKTPVNKRASSNSDGAGGGKLAGLLKNKLWSPSPSDSLRATEFELDGNSSVTSSHRTAPSVQEGKSGGGGMFGSIAFSSPRSSSGDLANNVTMVEGKLLPPPPARMEAQDTIASLVEAELETPEYGVDDEDETESEERASGVSSLGGWFRNSVSRIAASDTAANLSKRATNLQLAAAQSASITASRFQSSDAAAQLLKAQTNLAIQAQLLKDRVAAEQIGNKVKEAGERLMASTGSERGDTSDFGPRETPFTPPTGHGSMNPSPPLSSPGAPRPLLLSSSARRAQNGSIDETLGTPTSSRRSSTVGPLRSPSVSPVLSRSMHLPLLSPDLSIPPLSRSSSRGSHGRSTSTFDTPTRAVPTVNTRPRSASQSIVSALVEDDDVPITSSRLTGGGGPRRRYGAEASMVPERADTTSSTGKGWTLTDAPVGSRTDVVTSAHEGTMQASLVDGLSGLAIQLPASSSASGDSPSDPGASTISPPPRQSSLHPISPSESFHAGNTSGPTETTFLPPAAPTETSFVPPSSASHDNTSSSISIPSDAPFDQSMISARPPSPLLSQPSLSRGAKVMRRPAATKKRSSRTSSMAGSVDFSTEGGTRNSVYDEMSILDSYAG